MEYLKVDIPARSLYKKTNYPAAHAKNKTCTNQKPKYCRGVFLVAVLTENTASCPIFALQTAVRNYWELKVSFCCYDEQKPSVYSAVLGLKKTTHTFSQSPNSYSQCKFNTVIKQIPKNQRKKHTI